MGRFDVRLYLCVWLVSTFACVNCDFVAHAGVLEEDGERFFLSVGVGPTVSDVSKFGIRIEDKAHMSIPYDKKNFQVQLHSSNFDWSEASRTPHAKFERKTSGLRTAFGYAVAGVRVELELEREKAKIVLENRENKLQDGGVPFLLVGDVLEYVLGDECDAEKFIDKTGLYGRDVSYIDNLVSESNKMLELDGMRSEGGYEVYKNKFDASSIFMGGPSTIASVLKKYTQVGEEYAAFKKMKKRYKHHIGTLVAALDKRGRSYFARTLAIREKGADVVEINDISTTTLTANLCYDFSWMEIGESKKLSPYACAGIGSSAIGIASNDWRVKVAGKVKAGVNLSWTPRYQVYLGGVYMKVLGGEDYTGIRTERLADDYSPRAVEEDEVDEVDTAIISFRLRHYGLEFGARVFF